MEGQQRKFAKGCPRLFILQYLLTSVAESFAQLSTHSQAFSTLVLQCINNHTWKISQSCAKRILTNDGSLLRNIRELRRNANRQQTILVDRQHATLNDEQSIVFTHDLKRNVWLEPTRTRRHMILKSALGEPSRTEEVLQAIFRYDFS